MLHDPCAFQLMPTAMYNRAKINLKDSFYLYACKPYLVFKYRRPADMYFQYKPCK